MILNKPKKSAATLAMLQRIAQGRRKGTTSSTLKSKAQAKAGSTVKTGLTGKTQTIK